MNDTKHGTREHRQRYIEQIGQVIFHKNPPALSLPTWPLHAVESTLKL